MRAARLRPELLSEVMPAPQRIAPFSAALSADLSVDDEEIGTGRIIALHDPAGNDAWGGNLRCVIYVRADVESELAADPMLGEVAWSWLQEALAAHGAQHHAPSGTVTRVVTETFGGMSDDEGQAQVEIRASWSPIDVEDDPDAMTRHVQAWGELLCQAAGLQPVPEGVATMPSRRGGRGLGR